MNIVEEYEQGWIISNESPIDWNSFHLKPIFGFFKILNKSSCFIYLCYYTLKNIKYMPFNIESESLRSKKHKRGKSIAIDVVKELIRAIFIAFLSIRYKYYT